VATTKAFERDARRFLSEDEIAELIDFLADVPTAGDLIPGTGGLRKLRWGAKAKGKRGGSRAIYFYHDAGMPLFLLAIYAKADKIDLSAAEKRQYRTLTDILKEAYGK